MSKPTLLSTLALGAALIWAPAAALVIPLDAIDSGFVTEAGGASEFDGLIIPSATGNYSVGLETHFVDGGLGGPGGTAPLLRRNYFVFDLTGVTSPIIEATLFLFNPVGGYESTDPTETFVLAGTAASPTDLAMLGVPTMPSEIMPADIALAASLYSMLTDSLLSMPALGTASLSAASDGTTVPIPLDMPGIEYLNALAGGLVVLGGEISTIDMPGPVPQQPFGFTGPPSTPVPVLLITTVEDVSLPGSLALLALGLIGLGLSRQRPA